MDTAPLEMAADKLQKIQNSAGPCSCFLAPIPCNRLQSRAHRLRETTATTERFAGIVALGGDDCPEQNNWADSFIDEHEAPQQPSLCFPPPPAASAAPSIASPNRGTTPWKPCDGPIELTRLSLTPSVHALQPGHVTHSLVAPCAHHHGRLCPSPALPRRVAPRQRGPPQ